MLSQLAVMDRDTRLEASLSICQTAAQWPGFQQAQTVALFASMKTEPETTLLIEEAWAQKKRVVFPRTWPEGRLTWHHVRDWADLNKREPTENCLLVPVEELECVFVPGLAFDAQGYRLGRGGGYYDRVLASLPGTVPCPGLMFAGQELDEVAHEAHDVLLRCVITENGLIVLPKN